MSFVSYNLLLNKHFTDREMYVHVHACSVAQSCLTLSDPMNYSPPGSSVYGISQTRYWSGLSFPSPGDLPDPRIESMFIAYSGVFFFSNWRLITLQHCSGFAINWHKSAMGVHLFPILSLLPPPSPSHPSGSSQCTIPSTLSHALNLDWRSVSHMITYMFQCYSFKSSHPHLLPQNPKVCSLHLCLFCCLAI